MPAGSRTTPRRTPSQERSRELVRCVREAGRQLLEDGGIEALTTNRIAERAGVSVGSLYQYFENKEAIVQAILADVTEEEVEAAPQVAEMLRDLSARERLRVGVELGVDHHLRMFRMGREVYRAHHAEFRRGARFPDPSGAQGAVEFAAQLIAAAGDELRQVQPDHAAYLLGRGLPVILRAALEDDPGLLEDPSFREELVLLFSRYLFPDGPPGPGKT